MTIPTKKAKHSRISTRLFALVTLICAFVAIPFLSSAANPPVSSARPVTSIAVTNSSSREIIYLYLSPVDRESWSADQLQGQVLAAGQSFTIGDASCSGNEIKVVAEDREGCFLYGIVSCAQASTGWHITNDLPRDCGN